MLASIDWIITCNQQTAVTADFREEGDHQIVRVSLIRKVNMNVSPTGFQSDDITHNRALSLPLNDAAKSYKTQEQRQANPGERGP